DTITNAWTPLTQDFRNNSYVLALLTVGSDVYIGGNFTAMGDVSASRVAKFNATTGTWSPLGAGVNGPVRALAVIGSDLYVGGTFLSAGEVPAHYIAKFNTIT